jgi:hypothetical protein
MGTAATATATTPTLTELSVGCATSIAAGDGNYPWVTGCTHTPNGSDYYLYYWGGPSLGWLEANGAGVGISVFSGSVEFGADNNYPAVVNAAGSTYYGFPGGSDLGSSDGTSVVWQEARSLCATSVYAGVTGSGPADQPALLVSACSSAGSGVYQTFSGSGAFTSWMEIPGGGTAVAVGSAAFPVSAVPSEAWVIGTNGNVYLWVSSNGTTGNWYNYGTPVDGGVIAISQDGSPLWVVGSNNQPYYLNSDNDWVGVSGFPAVTKVDVGGNGTVWLVDTDGNIWYYN